MVMANLTIAQLVALAQQAGWSGADVPIAAAVAMAESSGNPSATNKNTNGSTDYGLWQVNTIHDSDSWGGPSFAEGCLDNPTVAAQRGKLVWDHQGWNAWVTYKSGAYLKYLAEAQAVVPAPIPTPTPTPQPTPVSGRNKQIDFVIALLNLIQQYDITPKE